MKNSVLKSDAEKLKPTKATVTGLAAAVWPDGEVLHDLWESLQLSFELLKGDGAAAVFIGRLKQRQRQVVQLLVRQRDGALTQTRLQNSSQLVWVDWTTACKQK